MICDKCKQKVKVYCARCKVELTAQNRAEHPLFKNNYGNTYFCKKCAERFLGRGLHGGQA